MTDYNASYKDKSTGKWKTIGRIKTNQWGNLQLSFKAQDLRDHLDNCGDWVNLSLFEAKLKEPERQVNADLNEELNDTIPF